MTQLIGPGLDESNAFWNRWFQIQSTNQLKRSHGPKFVVVVAGTHSPFRRWSSSRPTVFSGVHQGRIVKTPTRAMWTQCNLAVLQEGHE